MLIRNPDKNRTDTQVLDLQGPAPYKPSYETTESLTCFGKLSATRLCVSEVTHLRQPDTVIYIQKAVWLRPSPHAYKQGEGPWSPFLSSKTNNYAGSRHVTTPLLPLLYPPVKYEADNQTAVLILFILAYISHLLSFSSESRLLPKYVKI